MYFGTNPFGVFHSPGSKEHIDLNKQATINFKPKQQFDLIPANSQSFSTDLTANAEFYSYYGYLKSTPTTRTVDPADNTIITFGDRKSILTSWNEIDSDVIQNNATQLWGDRSWSVTDNKEIDPLSAARGEVVANNLNVAGKKQFMQRKRSTWLAHQSLQMLIPSAREQIEVDRDQYTWVDPDSGETVKDGMTVLYLILQHLRPNIRINVFNELKKIREIRPQTFGYDVGKWLSAMATARLSIISKAPQMYPDEMYLSDLFAGAELVPCSAFKAEVSSMKNKWNLGDLNLTSKILTSKLRTLYTNMDGDDSFKTGLQANDQIIALATKVTYLENALSKATVALTTLTDDRNGNGGGNTQGGGGNGGGGNGGGKQHHTVPDWKLEFKGTTMQRNGKEYSWCTEDHWSAGIKHNGMYQLHDTHGHADWRKRVDAEKAAKRDGAVSNTADQTNATSNADQKKLSLSDNLRAALTTHAGLSHDEMSRIWTESNEDSGNY